MKKRNSDIIIMIIGILVLIAGVLAYLFLRTDYFKKENNISGNIENERDSEIYQFLLDTKDIYCEYVELGNYYNKLLAEAKNGKQDFSSAMRIIAKKTLAKNDILGLSGSIANYVNKYSDSVFPKSVEMQKFDYDYFIKAMQNMENMESSKDSYAEDTVAFIAASKESRETLLNVIYEEWEAVRGNDINTTLQPNIKEELELLDLETLCPRRVHDENN